MTNSGQFSRTQLLLGPAAMERLAQARVAVFGLGGVGSYAAEALARSGIGAMDVVDHDKVSLTNINRQAIATLDTVGQYKAEVMAERIRSINPDCQVRALTCFYLPATAEEFDFSQYDYILDCVDTVTGKLQLIEQAKACGTPIISCMGAANKLDPTAFEVADIEHTSICPLAKIIRKESRKRGLGNFKVVYSKEPARGLFPDDEKSSGDDVGIMAAGTAPGGASEALPGAKANAACNIDYDAPSVQASRHGIPGSVAFVPSVAGLIMAGEVIKDLAGIEEG